MCVAASARERGVVRSLYYRVIGIRHTALNKAGPRTRAAPLRLPIRRKDQATVRWKFLPLAVFFSLIASEGFALFSTCMSEVVLFLMDAWKDALLHLMWYETYSKKEHSAHTAGSILSPTTWFRFRRNVTYPPFALLASVCVTSLSSSGRCLWYETIGAVFSDACRRISTNSWRNECAMTTSLC